MKAVKLVVLKAVVPVVLKADQKVDNWVAQKAVCLAEPMVE